MATRGRPRKSEEEKAKPLDKLICEYCGKTFTRAHRTSHLQTKNCRTHQKFNKFLKLKILENDKFEFKDHVTKEYIDKNGKSFQLTEKQAAFYNDLAKEKGKKPIYKLK